MRRNEVRRIVKEYFICDDLEADEIAAAALRVRVLEEALTGWPRVSEEELRKMLVSTRALFAHTFHVEK